MLWRLDIMHFGSLSQYFGLVGHFQPQMICPKGLKEFKFFVYSKAEPGS